MKLCLLILVTLLLRCSRIDSGSHYKKELEIPLSNICQEDCFLCGADNSEILNQYRQSQAIVVLCLNSWSISNTWLYEYDDSGNRVEEPGYTSYRFHSHGGEGSNWRFYADPGRHVCEMTIYYGEDSWLNWDILADWLCQDCLDKVVGAVCGLGTDGKAPRCDVLVDMGSGEIYPVSTGSPVYYIGDMWVHVDHVKEDVDKVYLVCNPKV